VHNVENVTLKYRYYLIFWCFFKNYLQIQVNKQHILNSTVQRIHLQIFHLKQLKVVPLAALNSCFYILTY